MKQKEDNKANIVDISEVEDKPKKKRGSKSASITANLKAKKEDISRIVGESVQYFHRPIVKDDDELAERLNEYFDQCQTTGQIPTVEDMSLALGTTRKTVWDWENGCGCSRIRSDMIKKAKEILAAIDAKLVSENKIPQITYIFRAKNFWGLSDKQEITVSTNLGNEQDMDAEGIARRYIEDGRTVETTFTDSAES